jgi:hypothetical protein
MRIRTTNRPPVQAAHRSGQGQSAVAVQAAHCSGQEPSTVQAAHPEIQLKRINA